MLLVAGQIALGIGLIVLGIAIFAFSKMEMDGGESLIDTIVSALSAAMVEISPYIAIIGLVLILVPGMQGIGIALLVAGIGLFIAGTALAASNSTEMKSWVEVLQLDQVSQWVSTALLLAGIALVAIGAMTLNPFSCWLDSLLGGGVALKALNSSGKQVAVPFQPDPAQAECQYQGFQLMTFLPLQKARSYRLTESSSPYWEIKRAGQI